MEDDKKLDDFIRKSIKEVGLDKPGKDFTSLVLSEIQVNGAASKSLVQKPLLSKSAWLVILMAVLTIFVYVIFNEPNLKSTWLSISKLNQLASFNLFGKIPSIHISKPFLYGFLTISFFGIVQVFLLKIRLDKYASLE